MKDSYPSYEAFFVLMKCVASSCYPPGCCKQASNISPLCPLGGALLSGTLHTVAGVLVVCVRTLVTTLRCRLLCQILHRHSHLPKSQCYTRESSTAITKSNNTGRLILNPLLFARLRPKTSS